jgi:cyclohexyl-isocyanide hydratase
VTATASAIRIGLLLFPDLTALDLVGPAEVFASAPGLEVLLVWKTLDPVRCGAGWALSPTTRFDDCPQLDVICVPGGSGQVALMDDEETLAFLRRQAEGARYVTAVCTGSLVLAAAGLLAGYDATSHWMSRDQLTLFGATPIARRVVKDRNRITGGGVTAGIDFALTLVAELLGADMARAAQLRLEYDPDPPFDAGSPEKAGALLTAGVRELAQIRQNRRLEASRRAAARLSLPTEGAAVDAAQTLGGRR